MMRSWVLWYNVDANMEMMNRIAIVILNWNGSKMLHRFLPAVLACSQEADIVVAENHSTDDSVRMLRESFPQVRLIELEQNLGFAQGYQVALAQVKAEFYVLLNNDVEVTPGWLGPLCQYMDSHPQVAACQPKLRCLWNRSRFEYAGACGGYVDALGYPYCRGRVMAVVETDEGQYDAVASVLWATGAALFIRSHVYWEVGGLDGRFFAHQEEIDLCWRIRSRGYGVACVPQSVVFHWGGGTLPKDSPHKTYLNFRNNLLLLYKNLPDDRLSRVMRIRWLLDALASLQFLAKGNMASFWAVWRARRDFCSLKHRFRADREENLRKTVVSPVPEQTDISILWQYYVRWRRTFTQLPNQII